MCTTTNLQDDIKLSPFNNSSSKKTDSTANKETLNPDTYEGAFFTRSYSKIRPERQYRSLPSNLNDLHDSSSIFSRDIVQKKGLATNLGDLKDNGRRNPLVQSIGDLKELQFESPLRETKGEHQQPKVFPSCQDQQENGNESGSESSKRGYCYIGSNGSDASPLLSDQSETTEYFELFGVSSISNSISDGELEEEIPVVSKG